MRRRLDLASAVARSALSRCCITISSSSSSSSRAASGALAGTSTGASYAASESATSSSSSSIKSRLFFGFSGGRRAFSSAAEAVAAAGGSASPSPRGPVSYASLALTMATGAGIVFYYDYLKQKKVKAALEGAIAKGNKKGGTAATAGAAAIGGPLSLVDSEGRPFTDQNLVGNGWHLLYFGFTRCPDICPDELEKIAAVTDALEQKLKRQKERGKKEKSNRAVTPVFVSVDPERDPPAHVGAYVKEFHPRMLGLTGTVAQCRAAARAYRVYYARAAASPGDGEKEEGGEKMKGKGSTEKNAAKVDEDYLIDHSIITYLIDPAGKFVTFFGKNVGAEEMVESVLARVAEWEEEEEEGGKEEEKETKK